MSQVIFDVINPDTTSGNQLAQLLVDFKDAVISGFSGTARPSELDAGGYWIDTASAGYLDFKIYTGTADVLIFRVNTTTGLTTVAGTENTFDVSRASADSVGPILKFIKERIASNGQTLVGDILGEVQFQSTTDAGVNQTSFRLKAVATDDALSTEFGCYLVLEQVNTDTNTLAEVARIRDGKIGVGVVLPAEKLHVSGNILTEKASEDALGPKNILKKKRVSGNGQVLSNDVVGTHAFKSTDQNGAELTVAEIETLATQNHTDVANGSQIKFRIKKTGETTFTERLSLESDTARMAHATITDLNTVNKIVLNKGGNKAAATSTAAGLEVEMSDATEVRISYDDTSVSKFKIGEVGSLREIAVRYIDTEANLTTYATTATNGQWVFASDTKKMYQVIDGVLVAVLAGVDLSIATGTLALNKGGTGATTKAAAFDALSPMTTSGDLISGGASGTGTRLAVGTNGQYLVVSGGVPTWSSVTPGAPVFARVYDLKSTGTNGGTFTLGAWRTRDLNTEDDPSGIVSIVANSFIIGVGTWVIEWNAPAAAVDMHQTRLLNITDSVSYLGSVDYAQSGATLVSNRSCGAIRFVVSSGTKEFQIEHRCATTQTSNGFGIQNPFGDAIFTQVYLTRY